MIRIELRELEECCSTDSSQTTGGRGPVSPDLDPALRDPEPLLSRSFKYSELFLRLQVSQRLQYEAVGSFLLRKLHTSGNPNVYYCSHRSLSLNPVLNQLNSVHKFTILILFFHLCFVLRGSSRQVFQLIVSIRSPFYPCMSPRAVHPILANLTLLPKCIRFG
jgi:hypothetical protein